MIRYVKSNREIKLGGMFKLAETFNLVFHWEPIGLAAARIEVRAFKVAMMPALATEIVCCSYTAQDEHRNITTLIVQTNHGLVQHRSGALAHLVKFVDATNAAITQDERATL